MRNEFQKADKGCTGMIDRAIMYQLNKRIHHLILFVSNRCNLRCKTCFVKFNNEKELSLGEVKTLSKSINNLSLLDVTGGEPFIRDDLPDICSLFRTKILSIPTNGYDPKRICTLVEEIKSRVKAEILISISIDGFKKTHDSIRAEGSFDKAVKTLALLKKVEGIRVKVCTVLCKENFDELEDFAKFIYSLKPAVHSVELLRGNPRNNTFSLPSVEDLRKKESIIFDILKRYEYNVDFFRRRVLRNYHRYLWDVSLKILERKEQLIPCVGGIGHCVVYANGDVSFCELLKPVGNLRKDSFENIWHSKKAGLLRAWVKNRMCYCTHGCVMLDNILLNPLSYFRLLKGAGL